MAVGEPNAPSALRRNVAPGARRNRAQSFTKLVHYTIDAKRLLNSSMRLDLVILDSKQDVYTIMCVYTLYITSQHTILQLYALVRSALCASMVVYACAHACRHCVSVYAGRSGGRHRRNVGAIGAQ